MPDPVAALVCYEEAREIYLAVGASGLAVAQVHMQLAQVWQKLGREKEATEAFKRAKSEYEACGDVENMDYLYLQVWDKGEKEEARREIDRKFGIDGLHI